MLFLQSICFEKEVDFMVKRNDPCPCGSGKKYKKCCMHKEEIQVIDVVEDEIETLLQSFYVQYPKRSQAAEFVPFVESWKELLKGKLQEELIEAICIDEFLFAVAPETWTNYIESAQKKMVRPSLIELTDQWLLPERVIGRVVDAAPRQMTVLDYVSEEEIIIQLETDRPVAIGSSVYTFVLPAIQDHLAVAILLFIPAQYNHVFDYFKWEDISPALVLEVFNALVEAGFDGNEWTSFEADVLQDLKAFLDEHQLESQELMEHTEDFLAEARPKARKHVAITAGALRFGMEQGYIEKVVNWSDLSKKFDISTSSIAKYAQELAEYVGK